jgi:hypothetical protein
LSCIRLGCHCKRDSLCFQVGFQAIAEALGLAAVKAAVAITAIIAGGRLVSVLKIDMRGLITTTSNYYYIILDLQLVLTF